MNPALNTRRPLKSRNTHTAQRVARWLSSKSVTPNQISVASVVFALLAACLLLLRPRLDVDYHALLLLAVSGCLQLRLLCNLFDGMVAIEGGKRTANGDLYNEIPDRIADVVVFIAAGYSLAGAYWGETLGWLAALLSVMTAYTRALAASLSLPQDFGGPMAKPHRMAVMTAACIFSAFEHRMNFNGEGIAFALCLIIVGATLTVMLRLRRASRRLYERENIS